MPNLEEKFEALEAQLAAQNTGIQNSLDAILTALGAPPPTATITLGDIYTQFAALLTLLENNATRDIGYYNTSLSELGTINTNLDLIITNNSLNAQRMIAAIYATFCDCATDSPLLAPPIDVTPSPVVDEAKCRRIQFYLSVFGNWLNKIANYGASGAAITSSTLSTLLGLAITDAGIVATGAEVGAVGGVPGIVLGAAVGLIAVAVYTFGGSVLIDYANQFNDPTLRDNMVMAMYAATNADEGYTAFKSTLLAGMDTIPAEVIYTLWWSAWSNDIYSGTPVVDDSAFDGSICAPPVVVPTGCMDLVRSVRDAAWNSGDIAIVGYDYFSVENSGAGPGSVIIEIDGVARITQTIVDGGAPLVYWLGTGSVARVINSSATATYIVAQACVAE